MMRVPIELPFAAFALRYLRPQRRQIGVLALVLAGSIALQLLVPQIVRSFLDAAQRGGTPAFLATAAGWYLASVVLGQALDALAAFMAGRVGWAATSALRSDLVLHVLRLDRGFHAQHTPAELIERVDGDVMALFNVFAQFALRVVGSLLLLLGAIVVLVLEDWRLGLLMSVYTLVALVTLQALRRWVLPATRAARGVAAELSSLWGEHLRGGDDLHANGAGAWSLGQHAALLERSLAVQRTSAVRLRLLTVLSEVLLALATGALFVLGSYLIGAGTLTLGGLYAAYAYTTLLALNLWQLAEHVADLQTALAGFERVQHLLATPPLVADGPGATLAAGALPLTCREVTFAYAGHDGAQAPVLDGVSFELPAGQMLGVVGRTGSGKSTLARLLVRLADPQAGSIVLGECDLRRFRLDELRHLIGFVSQDVQIFHASLRDNLTLFDDTVADETLWRTLADLGLRQWAATLGEGLDTPLVPGGLSAGEAQLVAFGRVFLRQPALVVLDEATARLDPATEQLIEDAIARLLQGRTAVVIAHRLTTLARADHILVLEHGAVAEYGAAASLAGDPHSRYAVLLRMAGVEAS